MGLGFLRKELEILLFESLVICVVQEREIGAVSKIFLLIKRYWMKSAFRHEGKGRKSVVSTLQFGHIESELVALFQHSFAPFGYKIVEPVREACHAIAKVVKAKIYAWKCVCHRRRVGGDEGRAHGTGGERWFKHCCHDASLGISMGFSFISRFSWDFA